MDIASAFLDTSEMHVIKNARMAGMGAIVQSSANARILLNVEGMMAIATARLDLLEHFALNHAQLAVMGKDAMRAVTAFLPTLVTI